MATGWLAAWQRMRERSGPIPISGSCHQWLPGEESGGLGQGQDSSEQRWTAAWQAGPEHGDRESWGPGASEMPVLSPTRVQTEEEAEVGPVPFTPSFNFCLTLTVGPGTHQESHSHCCPVWCRARGCPGREGPTRRHLSQTRGCGQGRLPGGGAAARSWLVFFEVGGATF